MKKIKRMLGIGLVALSLTAAIGSSVGACMWAIDAETGRFIKYDCGSCGCSSSDNSGRHHYVKQPIRDADGNYAYKCSVCGDWR